MLTIVNPASKLTYEVYNIAYNLGVTPCSARTWNCELLLNVQANAWERRPAFSKAGFDTEDKMQGIFRDAKQVREKLRMFKRRAQHSFGRVRKDPLGRIPRSLR